MKAGEHLSAKKLLSGMSNQGFTLVEVLIVIMIIPLILGVSFGVMSAALRAYRAIDSRSSLSSAGTGILEAIGQDIRSLIEVYSTSSDTRLNGRAYGHVNDVEYEHVAPASGNPGLLMRNGKNMAVNGVSVTSCKFDYLKPAEFSGYESVHPSLASSVRVRLTLESGSLSMTFESTFHMRNS